MKNNLKKNRVSIILEFGIPPYREFLFKYLNSVTRDFLVIYNGEKFIKEEYEYPTYKPRVLVLGKFKVYFKLIRILANSDVIIGSFNFWRPSCWMPVFYLRKKKHVLWGHIKGNNDNVFSRGFKKACIKRADYILTYTEEGKRYAVDVLNAKKENVLVVRNTLSVTNSQFSDNERRYFLYVGRIQERKGLDIIIRLLTNIKKETEILRIVGDGDYKIYLMKLVKGLKLDKKVQFFPGTYDDSILQSHFQNAIAYVSPNHVGLGVVHSFSYGIPILTKSDAKHAPEFEYCSSKNSFLYYDEKELFVLVKKLLNDQEESFIKGQNAFHFYQSYLGVENMKEAFYNAIYK